MNGISLMMSKPCCPMYDIGTRNMIDLFPRRLSNLHLRTTLVLATTRMLKHRVYSSSMGNDNVTGTTSVSGTVVPYHVLRLGLIGLALIKDCDVVAEFISTRGGIEGILKSNHWCSCFIGVAIGLLAKGEAIANKTQNRWHDTMRSYIQFELNEVKKIAEISNEILNMMESNTNVLVDVEQPHCHLTHAKGMEGFLFSLRCKLKHMYNTKDSSIRLAYEGQPRHKAIIAFAGEIIVKVACRSNHTVAVDSNGHVYTWGYGGYGRLGHKEQKDEWSPRRLDFFTKNNVVPSNAVDSAGSVNCAVTAGGGQMYMWGKIKNTSDY